MLHAPRSRTWASSLGAGRPLEDIAAKSQQFVTDHVRAEVLTEPQSFVTFGCTSVKPRRLCCQISSCCSEGACMELGQWWCCLSDSFSEEMGYTKALLLLLFFSKGKNIFNLVLENGHRGLAGNCQKLNLGQMLGLKKIIPNSYKQLKTRCFYKAQDSTKLSSSVTLAWMWEIFKRPVMDCFSSSSVGLSRTQSDFTIWKKWSKSIPWRWNLMETAEGRG